MRRLELDELSDLESTIVLARARPAVAMAKRAGAPVDLEVATGRHFDRVGVQPPVEPIEVVGGFVDEEGPALGFQAEPSPEVVRAMMARRDQDPVISISRRRRNASPTASRRDL